MQAPRIWLRWLSAAVCLCGTIALGQDAPQEPAKSEQTKPVKVQVLPSRATVIELKDVNVFAPNQDVAAGDVLFVYSDSGSALAEPGKFWVGLMCVDAGEAMRNQLGLDAGVGLIVENVTDDAPAKKAGIQKYDLLLAISIPSDDPKAEPKPLKDA